MKQLLIVLLFVINAYSDTNNSYAATLASLKSAIDSNATIELLDMGSKYIKSVDTQANRDKAINLYNDSADKMRDFAVKGLIEIYCSKEATQEDVQKCTYWSNKAKSRSIDVDKLKQITYKLNIQAVDGKEYIGSAVALSKDGKLVTAYHKRRFR